MLESSDPSLMFLKHYTVSKEQVLKQRDYNKSKLKEFGILGTTLVNPLLIKFLDCEEIATRWSCEGYRDAPNYHKKISHIAFFVTDKGLIQLLNYLENCRREIAMSSEYWQVIFHHDGSSSSDQTQTITWNFNSFLTTARREFMFKTMCEEFDLYFK